LRASSYLASASLALPCFTSTSPQSFHASPSCGLGVHSASYSLRERRIGTKKRPAVCSVCRNVEWLLSDEHSSVVTGAIWPVAAG
jgi:hypothetical protein